MGSLLTVRGWVFSVVRFGFDHIWRSVLRSWFSSESGNQSATVSLFNARLLCTGCRLSGSLGTPWLIRPRFVARLLVPRLWAARFFGFSLYWFGTFVMVMGCSVMFFGCLCSGCGLGFLWDWKVKHVSCAQVVCLNYLWLLCLVTQFVGFSFDGFVSG